MPMMYEYRCDRCGQLVLVPPEDKARYGTSNGDRIDLPWADPDCPGTLRRVWGANVATATVEGFYAHAAHGGSG